MSTPLTGRINALTALANEKTGAEDTTLTEAVKRLIDGYGSSTGIDIIVEEEQVESCKFADYLYDLIGGETGKIYFAVRKDMSALTHQLTVAMVFARYTTSCIGGFIRWENGNNYKGYGLGSTYYGRAYVGDVYTIYCPDSGEIYPVGTELIAKYVGRKDGGEGDFYIGRLNEQTGEMWLEDDPDYPSSGPVYALSLVYIPADASYTYTKGLGYLYRVLCYDKNKEYLGYVACDINRKWEEVPTLPQGTRYIRIAIHQSTSYRGTILIRTA